jgi:hypothetical protein
MDHYEAAVATLDTAVKKRAKFLAPTLEYDIPQKKAPARKRTRRT